jgi:PAS domain S-box-containing protein
MSVSSEHLLTPRRFAFIASALVAAIGVSGCVGWVLDIAPLRNISGDFPSMAVNTAAGMLLSGLTLALLAKQSASSTVRHLAGGLALLIAFVGALTLAEHLVGWGLGIDQLLFTGAGDPEKSPARMSPATALCFFFAGLALFSAAFPTPMRWRRPVVGALAAAVSAFGGITVAAYLFDAALGVHLWNHTGVAIHTAAGFVLIGAGLLATLYSDGGLRWALDTGTSAGVMVGAICLIVLAAISNDFTYLLQHDEAWVSHTHEVIRVVEAINGGMADLVSGQRGFIITGDEHMLDRRLSAKKQVEKDLAEFLRLTSDNPGQTRRGDSLAPLIAERNAWGDRLIAARRELGFPEVQRLIATSTGVGLSEKIRKTLLEMRAEEYTLLEVRQKRSSATTTKTFLLLPLGVILSLSLLFLALFLLNAGACDRARVESVLRASNEHLRSTEERFRLLISGVRDYAIYLLDEQGNVATWNTGAQQLKQWTAEEIIGQHFSRFYPAESLAESKPQRALEIANCTGHYEEQGWRVRKDGTMFWADVLITAIRDDRGRPAGYAKVTRDLTEHRRIELALKEDEARHAAVIGSAMDAVITVDERQLITLFNPAAEKMFGYAAAAVMGTSLERLIPDRFRGSHASHIRGFANTNTSRRKMGALAPIYGLRSDGEEFAIEASISQAHVGGQRIFSVILRDITERNRTEEALRQQASLLDLAPVLVRDMQSRIVFWSSGLEKLYNYSRAEAQGRISHELLHTEFPEPLAQIERALELNGSWEGELRHSGRAGGHVFVNSLWVLYRDAQGTPVRILEVNADVTARKRAEVLQLRSQKLEALGTLSGGIAHDFNNILLAITGNTKLAIADVPPEHPAQESLKEIAKAGARAIELVRRILTFSRPGEMKRQILDLQPVVEEALRLVRASLPTTIAFRTDFAPNLPTVLADSTQVHQIIVNLVTNAGHAIGSRSDGAIEVRLETARLTADDASPSLNLPDGEYVRLYVSDNGCGMDRATLDRIYDPFFTTKKPGEGTGLGLSVVHGIMKNHDGGIAVYSEPDRGTAFRLFFPVAGVASTAAPEAVAETQRRRTENILYVDDEEPLVALIKRTLERLGYKVTGETNPAMALEIFRSNPFFFDGVVTDLAMPHLSGFDLSAQILALRPDLPIIMTSGYVRPEDQQRALAMGLRDLILKPDAIEQLARTLDELFRQDAGAPAGHATGSRLSPLAS